MNISKMLKKGKRRVILEINENIEFKDREEFYDYVLNSLDKTYEENSEVIV